MTKPTDRSSSIAREIQTEVALAKALADTPEQYAAVADARRKKRQRERRARRRREWGRFEGGVGRDPYAPSNIFPSEALPLLADTFRYNDSTIRDIVRSEIERLARNVEWDADAGEWSEVDPDDLRVDDELWPSYDYTYQPTLPRRELPIRRERDITGIPETDSYFFGSDAEHIVEIYGVPVRSDLLRATSPGTDDPLIQWEDEESDFLLWDTMSRHLARKARDRR